VYAGWFGTELKLRKAVKKSAFLCNSIGIMLCGRICSSDYKTMLAGLEIIVLVDDFETYIQFAKLIKLQGTCLFRIWRG
jgi:hypothetical protein